ncbi:nuclear transport factor 2 family protein [Nocardia salmonicida]|uniref:nuclear transport factor 2 family protein n=1 Tax=Nocardia salmonicida TaxID=53431 RepID=UPI003788CB2A
MKPQTHKDAIDPHQFVAEAQRITNTRDIAALRQIFADNAIWTSTIDGIVINAHGIGEIEDYWLLMCRFMQARKIFVRKELIAFDDGTLVSGWTGTGRGGSASRGVEVWKFDANGLIINQRADGFLNTAPDASLCQSLRLLATYPVNIATFGWLRFRVPRLQ